MIKIILILSVVIVILLFSNLIYRTLYFNKTSLYVSIVNHELPMDCVTFKKGNLLNKILNK